MMKWAKIYLVTILVFLVGFMSVNAQITDKISIHGFGEWGYGNSDGNHYLISSDEGEYQHSLFALNIQSNIFEKLTIAAQTDWEISHQGQIQRLDFAFAQWSFSDAVKFRVGRVKHPFGIYTEIYNVGTVRPFYFLPQSVYGQTGMTAEAFNGVGLTGAYYAENGWGLKYDIYGGAIDLENFHSWRDMLSENSEDMDKQTMLVKELVGSRIKIMTPVRLLSFGFSAYKGKTVQHQMEGSQHEEDGSESTSFGDHIVYGIHVEYLTDKLWVRSEYSGHDHRNSEKSDAAYLEVAFKFTEHWQAAARYDKLNIRPVDSSDISQATSLIEHEDLTFGLNYWFNPNFVLKFEYHKVNGNRFALPENLHLAVKNGTLNTKTNLFQFCGQFSF